MAGTAHAQRAPKTPIHIAAQPMDRALQALARATGANILFSPAAVSGLQARPVTGARNAVEAVRMMIRGAPLAMSVERSGAIVIRPLPVGRPPVSPRPASPAAAAPVARSLPPPPPEEELIVVARRREEHLLQTPVTATTLSPAELERRGYRRMDDLVQMVPQLVVSEVGASPQGGIILIRGIGVGEANPLADQAVSFNIDGMQVSRANIRRVAEFDTAQVEILKGPQALYFGKNSPAGIIVVRTRDPGPHFEANISAEREFVGRENRIEATISGPLTDAIGARLALFGSQLGGTFHNDYPEGSLFSPDRRRLPYNRMWGGRLTLKYDDGGPLSARLKLSRNGVRMAGGEATMQTIACPLVDYSQLAPQTDDCKANGHLTRPDSGPLFEAVEPLTAPEPFAHQDQTLISLDVHQRLGPALSLTLTSGYYALMSEHSASFVLAEPAFARFITAGYQRLRTREFTQEARISSDFVGPLNFMIGGFYQHAVLHHLASTLYDGLSPTVLGRRESHDQTGNAWSGFGQLTYALPAKLELSGGVRLSYERKRIANYGPSGVLIPTVRPSRSWTDLSPEATLSWRPSDRLTLYGGYRRGFLSGGFNAGTGDPATDRSYDQQVMRGFEGGAKAALMGGRLKAMAATYRYISNGLQVTATIPRAVGTGSDQSVVNAGRARIAGAELEAHYADGGPVKLHAAIAYNDARYARFIAPCYAGQSIAQGCTLMPRASGAFRAQDLTGRPLSRAPLWNMQGGAVFTFPVATERSLSFSADLSFTSGYYAQSTSKPDSWQSAYAMLDTGILYSDERQGVSVQLIARNITNRYSFYRSLDQVFTGSGTGTASARPSDTLALINPGRRILLRLSKRFGS